MITICSHFVFLSSIQTSKCVSDLKAWLDYCEDLTLGEYSDWRLPDNKELQSIVEYGTTDVPAIDTAFFDSTFNDSYGGGDFIGDYGWYWTSTTLKDFPLNASYIAFGRAYSTTSDDLTDTSS